MKKHLILFLLITTLVYSQQEASVWYFGINAGIRFNTDGTVTALTDGQLSTPEGCATISDNTGNLLFYTDGITVYNRNHTVMINGNGLTGNWSTTQSATIVPKPGSSSLFYIFTLDALAGANGFRYSIVDINLDGGLGAVTTQKNILVYTPSTEKLAIVKHANNNDFWVVTHGWNNNSFYSHILTSSGLNNIPVVSNVGLVVTGSTDNVFGYMKISPNGTKLAISNSSIHCELLDFNDTTGVVSNPQILYNGYTYGVEFSPNSEVLYVSAPDPSPYKILQFDLTSSNISGSSQLVYNTNLFGAAALQLGPDNKIYIAHALQTKLGVINNPNILGLGCNIQMNVIDLAGRRCDLGLPPFVSSFFFSPAIQFDNACEGQNATITFNTNQTVLSAIWDFGDGSPVQNSVIGNHVYTTAGTYPVSVTVVTPLGSGTSTRNIVVSTVPTATQPPNILQCDTNNNGLFNFDLTTQNSFILNGQNSANYTVRYFANTTGYTNNIAIANPSNYENAVAYQQQTIIAEVSNNANATCKTTTNFLIDVFDSPLPNSSANIPNLTTCDNTTFGTDIDGRVIFNLTQRASAILNGQSATQFTIEYYRDVALTNPIGTPSNYTNTNSVETIYVKVTNNDNINCVATTSFIIQVFPLPTINNIVDLKQCDDNTDGFSIFNLTEANAKISSNFANETITYFETVSDAQSNINQIPNFITYTNQTVSNDVVYVRVANPITGCFRIATLNLIVSTTQVPVTFTRTFTECDDAILGTNTDGISTFNFASVDTEVRNLFPANQLLTITYYRNLADALQESNAIADISNYRNIGYTNTQNIYTRVDSDLDNDCLLLKSFITLNVERIPIVQPKVYTECDDNQDGIYSFDTSNIESALLSGLTNVTVTYFDANNTPLSSPLPNPFTTSSQILRAVVKNNTPKACSYETTIQFIVDDLPEAFAIPLNLVQVCDNEAEPTLQDGQFAFDTSTFQNTILGSQTGMLVTYFDANNNPLPNPLPNPFVTKTQNIQVVVTNPVNTSCKANLIIPFVVNPVPDITLIASEIVCNEKTLNKVINAGLVDETTITDFSYVWKKDGVILSNQNGYFLSVNEEGIYTVTVTNAQNCSRTRTITVIASDIATIENISVSDLSNNNTIVISVTGAGDYEFSLDNQTYQQSSTFSNIQAGVYTVYVKDLNGCGITQQEVSVLGIPSFFTPNGDGFNDYWNLNGVSNAFNSKTTISIFDRFGKLLKQITPSSQGWDGTFNNQNLPATDYWYTIVLENGKTINGHFTLKR